jgi:RNA polymerase sigma factor (sigma-70 family)
MSNTDIATIKAIELVWRQEAAKLIGGLTRVVRDISLAEDCAQQALLAALDKWPREGIPPNPGAWLMRSAKYLAYDHFRHRKMAATKVSAIAHDYVLTQDLSVPDIDAQIDDDVGDDVLGLIFTACHPAIPLEARVALALRVVSGLTTAEIAKAFLVSETTMAQRIVRAKRTLSEGGYPFEVPRGLDRAARLNAVLEVIYLIFNEGYVAAAGEKLVRPALGHEALRLAGIVVALTPHDPEPLALESLMAFQLSRFPSRIDGHGDPVLLENQDRAKWDQELIGRGFTALARALALLGDPPSPGPYFLQAAIAACHADAKTMKDTDWVKIVQYYDVLAQQCFSPVVELNRAVAHAMAYGPDRGLSMTDRLLSEPLMAAYYLLPSIRGDLLFKLGRLPEARQEFLRAAAMTNNNREKTFLLQRAERCQLEQAAVPPPRVW